MNDFEKKIVREIFSRIFVLAVINKIHFISFTNMLEKSKFINLIEKNKFNDYFNTSIEQIFFDITNFKLNIDNSYGIYNDSYWCGQNYFDLHYKFNKSFSYIFLKLPFDKMMDIYSIYHEMDFSSLALYFNQKEKEKTILKLLCEKKNCSLNDISKETLISLNTLKKYNSDDEMLYSGSYQYISKLVNYFDVPYQLFVK